MVRRRRRESRFLSHRFVVDDRVEVVRLDQPADAPFEGERPVVRLDDLAAPGIGVEVVDDVTGAEDEHAFLAQRPQAAGQGEMLASRESLVDAQLHDRYLRPLVHVDQEGPGAVVETPALIHFDARRREQVAHPCGQSGRSGRRVLHLIERPGEPAEVMDGPRPLLRADPAAWHVPMRGHRQDRARLRQLPPELRPGLRPGIGLDGIHRIAMTEKRDRHPRHVHSLQIEA